MAAEMAQDGGGRGVSAQRRVFLGWGKGQRESPPATPRARTAGLGAAAGGLANARAPHRPDEHHAEPADRFLLASDAGPGSRAFDRLSTVCRRRGDGKRGFGARPGGAERIRGDVRRTDSRATPRCQGALGYRGNGCAARLWGESRRHRMRRGGKGRSARLVRLEARARRMNGFVSAMRPVGRSR